MGAAVAAGNTNEALKHFYTVRSDATFGRWATFMIIEICLHTDNQTFEGDIFENIVTIMKFNEKINSQEAAISTAELLLEVCNVSCCCCWFIGISLI